VKLHPVGEWQLYDSQLVWSTLSPQTCIARKPPGLGEVFVITFDLINQRTPSRGRIEDRMLSGLDG